MIDTSGLVRRVRRMLGMSQRELAERLRVSASMVARWELDQVEITVRMFGRLLELVGGDLVAITDTGEQLQGMSVVAEVRDRGGRRYPSHLQVVPRSALDQVLSRSRHPETEEPGPVRTIGRRGAQWRRKRTWHKGPPQGPLVRAPRETEHPTSHIVREWVEIALQERTRLLQRAMRYLRSRQPSYDFDADEYECEGCDQIVCRCGPDDEM